MKIAIFIPTLNIGGVEQAFVRLANALVEDGFEINFVVCRCEGLLLSQLDKRICVVDLGGLKLRSSLWALKSYIENAHPKYMITGSNVHNEFLVFANMLSSRKTHVILTQHGFIDDDVKGKRVYRFFVRPLMRYFYPKAHRVVAISKGVETMLENLISVSNLTQTYNLFDIASLAEKAHVPLIQNFVSLEGKEYMIFAGRFSPVKNLKFLIDAFSMFARENSSIHLLLVGEGEDKDELVEHVTQLSLVDKVLIMESTVDVLPLIRHAKLLVLSSKSECLPSVIVESLAIGTTVLSTPTLGATELLMDGEFGYLSKNFDDVNAFASLMQKAIESPFDKAKLLERAESFDIKNVLPQYRSLLS